MVPLPAALRQYWSQVQAERSDSYLSRWLFLRLLGLIYLIAFISLWTQIEGLIGSNGILPVADYLKVVGERAGAERFWWLPTFCWLSSSDWFLHFQCATGVLLSMLLILGIAPVAEAVLMLSAAQTLMRLSRSSELPRPILTLLEAAAPLRTVNSYGLFAVMTTTRPEIVVEGSNDGVTWLPYEFKWKPGDLNRRPAFVAPHQPRLDWQMWFAALGNYRQNPWFVNFLIRLLQGSSEVLTLLEKNPFPDKPPRYVRAALYEYRFTDRATRDENGAWWRRERKGLYCPEISLRQN
jgi:lipase maturation factor